VGGPAAIWESGDLVAQYAWPAERRPIRTTCKNDRIPHGFSNAIRALT
jgi:hypothetical protein